MQCDVAHREAGVTAAYVDVLADEVRHQQRLWIHPVMTTSQFGVGEAVAFAVEAELAGGVPLGPRQEVVRQAALPQAEDGPLLDDAGTRPPLDELTALRLQYDAVDGRGPQDVADGETRGARAHDDDRSVVGGKGESVTRTVWAGSRARRGKRRPVSPAGGSRSPGSGP